MTRYGIVRVVTKWGAALLLGADSSKGERSSMRLAARQSALSRGLRRSDLGRRGHVRAARLPAQRREFCYGSPEFRVASDFARRLPYSPSVSTLIGSLLRDPALIRALIAVWQLPVVDLRLSRADANVWSEATPVGRMISGARRAQAVLELPTVEERYLSGRPKQALRTNLRHARELGVTSDRIPTYEAWFEAASVVLDARCDGLDMARHIEKPEPGQQVAYYVSRDADETPLAFARVALLGQFAALFTLLSHHDRRPRTSWARYQLHTFLALDLGRSGIKHLVVGSALRETAGTQYFQHLLGYQVRNLRVEVIESGAT
jgi:hypothetical protein